MSDLAPVLELLHTAPRRWRTLRADGWAWHERTGVREPWRLWLQAHDHVRAEFAAGPDHVTMVEARGTWWSWSPSQPLRTNGGDVRHSHGRSPGHDLVDPALLLPAVELTVRGHGTAIGRASLELVATPTVLHPDDEEGAHRGGLALLGAGGDEYLLTVDAERGVLLRSETRRRGEPVRIVAMDAVAFDESLPAELFRPPAGTAAPVEPRPRAIHLREAVTAVPFTVLVPAHPLFPVERALLIPARPEDDTAPELRIHYRGNRESDRDREVVLRESAQELAGGDDVRWRDQDHDVGDHDVGEDRRVRPVQTVIRLVRDGTHVELRSAALSSTELVTLARSLVPLGPVVV